MLTIRSEQMKTLEQDALRRFEGEMVLHLSQFAPRHSEVLREPGVRRVIRLGLERAEAHGFTNRGPVRFYIELMFMFGSDFDTDPLLSWAGATLGEATASSQAERADRLYGRTVDYIERVAGPNNAHAIEALRRIHRARLEDYPVSGGDFEAAALRGLNDVYPQKCADAGEPALRALIRGGLEMARRHSAASDLGVALFIALRFALGHGFVTDPLFPWIAGALDDPIVTDPARRVERLLTRARTYLGEALAYLERR